MKIKNPFRRLTLEEADAILAGHASALHIHHSLEARKLRFEASEKMAEAAAHEIRANNYLKEVEKHRK